MKNVTYFFILFLLTLTTPLFADKNSNEEVLKRLDRVMIMTGLSVTYSLAWLGNKILK